VIEWSRPEHVVARYVAEQRPGLSWARNVGLEHATGAIVAFTDDDVVVDRHWISELVRAFDIAPDVGCVTGQILPHALSTDLDRWREAYAGATKFGFERRVFDLTSGGSSALYPFTTGECGYGMNMAFRADVLRNVDGFSPALGAGTRTGGGEDLAAFFEVLNAGWRLVFEPSAMVSHMHRASFAELQTQMTSWGSGLTAYIAHAVIQHPESVPALVSRSVGGIRSALSSSSSKNRGKPADYPHSLTKAELFAMPRGPFRYVRSRREAARLARGLLP
jgi:cellulose synthase/poly-beta-1,6-N-acetylglucosamine synthase-like glycosyltransferase